MSFMIGHLDMRSVLEGRLHRSFRQIRKTITRRQLGTEDRMKTSHLSKRPVALVLVLAEFLLISLGFLI